MRGKVSDDTRTSPESAGEHQLVPWEVAGRGNGNIQILESVAQVLVVLLNK